MIYHMPTHTPLASRHAYLPCQVIEWENAGLVRRGITASVASAVRRALRPLPLAAVRPAHDDHGPSLTSHTSRIGTLAVHARRGDKEAKGSGHSSATRYPVAALRMAIRLMGQAMTATGLFPGGLHITLYTDAGPNATLAGCPSAAELPARLICRVASGTILDDLHAIIKSDVFMMSTSSFAILGYYLREGEPGSRPRPTIVPVPQISQFYAASASTKRACHVLKSATDGVPDGEVAGATKPRVKGQCHGKARPHVSAPPSMIFIDRELKELDDLGSATVAARRLKEHAAVLGARLQRLLRSPL